jgi:exonuclease III
MVNINQNVSNTANKAATQIKECIKITQESLCKDSVRRNSLVISDNCKKQVLKICHQNICGLGSKTDELLASLYPNLPDILCISEHHLNSMQIQLISMEDYRLGAEFCRQFFHKGGVCMFIQKQFSFSVINIEIFCKEKELEACALKLKLLSSNVCIITVYRSPNGNFQSFLKGLDNIIKKIYKPNVQLIICGDFNINYLNESKEKQDLNNILNSYNLVSVIHFPTRITYNSKSTIDNIFFDTTKFTDFATFPLLNGLSDHDAQMLGIYLHNVNWKRPNYKAITVRKMDSN